MEVKQKKKERKRRNKTEEINSIQWREKDFLR
jgi:hypothetical protein